MKAMMRLVLMGILLVLLAACGTSSMEPSSQLVQRALTLQLSQIQQHLSQQLQSSAPRSFEIDRLVIKEKQPLVIGDLPAYQVRGSYDLTIQLPRKRITQQHNPFEVYLQRQQEGKTWRLALPQSSGKDTNKVWRTYSIQ
jgi:hypothetical protein